MSKEGAGIMKTVFRPGSSGLVKFSHMPFGLSNSPLIFCHHIEMHQGDQQFVTLLSYLDNICISVASIDEICFKQLKSVSQKMKPEKCLFFQCSIFFLGYVLSADSISAYLKKVKQVKNWLMLTNQEDLHSFLGLASSSHWFILKFIAISKCFHQLNGPSNIKKYATKAETVKEKFQWIETHQKAFSLQQAYLTGVQLLKYPDFS